VRDYVHVEDIARAHVMALNAEIPSGVYNLGSNNGTSNREIIAAAERITGKKLKVVMQVGQILTPKSFLKGVGKPNTD
jgi:UDP-glucose 4-epimerase